MKHVIKQYFKPAKDDFNKFLQQCKYAVNKLYGFNIPTKSDFWSIIDPGETLTRWERLKENGFLYISEQWDDKGNRVVLDFDFEGYVYAEIFQINF